MARPRTQVVSVIIPTHKRPALLRRAVGSALAQELPKGYELEVVIGVSDPAVDDDVLAANEIAAADSRVRVALGPARGASGTRNAAIAEARGGVFAFMDDDCEAQPGWLAAGVAAFEAGADIVQGKTQPGGDIPPYAYSVWVTPPSWLWETCNLMVRRDWIERVGGFNESWNSDGRESNLFQFGEDVEIGWAMVRGGAKPAFVPEALVHHAVFPRDYRGYLAYKAGIRRFPQLFRTTPEARRIFYRGYFVNRRHVAMTAAACAALAGAAAALSGRRTAGLALAAVATAAYLSPLRGYLIRGDVAGAGRDLVARTPEELVEFGSALYGSLRWRRLLL